MRRCTASWSSSTTSRREFAERVIEAYHGRPNDGFSIALSGGETARRCYERLADDAGTQIDWWKVDVYWGDERCVPLDDDDSNYRLGREALLERVGAVNANYPMRCEEGPDPYQLRSASSAGSTSSTSASAPTATRRRCSPARRRSTPTPAGSSS